MISRNIEHEDVGRILELGLDPGGLNLKLALAFLVERLELEQAHLLAPLRDDDADLAAGALLLAALALAATFFAVRRRVRAPVAVLVTEVAA